MLRTLMNQEMIRFASKASDWEEAIDLVAAPVLEAGKITPAYVEAVKENVRTNGAYIVLRDEFALPHARPSEAVQEMAMSILILKTPVGVGDEALPVKVMVFLAATDSQSHLDALAGLVNIISEDDVFEKLKNSQTTGEVMSIIHGNSE